MDINAQALFFKRLTNAVHSLGTLLTYKEPGDDLEELLLLAKMRRVGLCFVAFIHYAAERAGISKRERELLDYEEILEILFQRGAFPAEDKDAVEELMAMYADITSYDPLISIDEAELVKHIPEVHDYLSNYIARESLTPVKAIARETTL